MLWNKIEIKLVKMFDRRCMIHSIKGLFCFINATYNVWNKPVNTTATKVRVVMLESSGVAGDC